VVLVLVLVLVQPLWQPVSVELPAVVVVLAAMRS
jgi:hypothetical protein